jgi:ABC-type amino acid transport substrate-binding protein
LRLLLLLLPLPANLTANLTVNQLAVQVSSLADLAQTSAYFGVPAESSIAAYFTSSMDKSALLLRPRMVEYKDTDAAVADVRRRKIAAFVTDHINALYFTQVSGRRCN